MRMPHSRLDSMARSPNATRTTRPTRHHACHSLASARSDCTGPQAPARQARPCTRRTLFLIFRYMKREGLQSSGAGYSLRYETRPGSADYLEHVSRAGRPPAPTRPRTPSRPPAGGSTACRGFPRCPQGACAPQVRPTGSPAGRPGRRTSRRCPPQAGVTGKPHARTPSPCSC
jgi:hypothetical protein